MRKDRCLYETLVFVFASSRPGGLQTISVKNSFAFVWVGWACQWASVWLSSLPQWGQNRKSQSGLGGQSESERLSVTTPHHCGWVSLWFIHTVGIVVLWVSVGVTHNVGVQQVRWAISDGPGALRTSDEYVQIFSHPQLKYSIFYVFKI